jgi:hypothetical protein
MAESSVCSPVQTADGIAWVTPRCANGGGDGFPTLPSFPIPDHTDREGLPTTVLLIVLLAAFALVVGGVVVMARTRAREAAAVRRRDAFLDAHMADGHRATELETWRGDANDVDQRRDAAGGTPPAESDFPLDSRDAMVPAVVTETRDSERRMVGD